MKTDIEKLFLDSLINSLPDTIYFKDTESRFLMINQEMAKRLNLKNTSEALGRTDFDFFDEEHAQKARDDELRVMQTGEPILGKEEFEATLDGEDRWILTTRLPLYDTGGELVGTFGISRDATQIKTAQQALLASEADLRKHKEDLEEIVKKRTEELSTANALLEREVQERRLVENSLRLSEERYRRLLQVNPTYIYTATIAKKKAVQTEHGPGCLNVTGYSPEEFERFPNLWIVMVHPEDRDFVKRFVTEDLTQRDHQNQIEHRIIHRDGRVRWVRNTVVHHYDDDGELVQFDGLVEDITARKHANERQRENERLRAISIMAQGVVDAYSSVIEQIASHAKSIADRVTNDTEIYEEATSIIDHTDVTTELNSRLSTVARAYNQSSTDSVKPVKIKTIINKAIKPLKKAFSRQKIEVKTFIPPNTPPVSTNPDQLLDTLTIMLMNSADAMPDGGTITITVSSKNILRSSHRWNQTARGGRYVILRISDTGEGMDRETARQVFSPFFSTKKAGGFGLGLSMAEAAAKSWGGWIRLRSKPGQGTVFRIFMPTQRQTTEMQARSSKPVATLRGRTALVVDDNPSLTTLISDALTQEGMKVITAGTGIHATDLFAANIDRVSLCILDMVLGEEDWQSAITKIYDLKPEVHVIVMSGFSRDFVRSSLPVGAWSFIQKPFDPPALIEMANTIVNRDVS